MILDKAAEQNLQKLGWNRVGCNGPEDGAVVMTMVYSSSGMINVIPLMKRGGLFFFPDESRHALYAPTHWKPL